MKHLLITIIAAVMLVGTAIADPIHSAALNGHLAGVQAQLDKGVDVNVKDEDGMTPLHWAAYYGYKKIVELLITEGADVDVKDESGKTPLHWAATKEIAELFIAEGADVNAKDEDGETALDRAIQIGRSEIADLLRKHGGKHGTLFAPATAGDIESVKELLAAGADVNAKNHFRETPLHWAASFGHKEIVELLIAEGADVNAKSDEWLLFEGGSTPLHYATIRNNTEMVELLIAEGADVDAKGDYGNTPLFDAARQGHKEIAELLIAEGADVNAQYYRGNRRLTPLDKAKEELSWDSVETKAARKEIADLLRKHGGKTGEELRALMPRLVQHGRFAFSFDAKEGNVYEVQDSFDLLNWEVIKTYTGTGETVRFDEERDHDPPQWFYRVMVVE